MKKMLLHALLVLFICSLVLVLPAAAAVNGKIAFVSNRDGKAQIYIMNPDGTGQTRLTNNQYNDTYPARSPDGTKIAFMSDRNGNSEIYIMNPDGTGQTRLTNNQAFDGWIGDGTVWTSDGKKIAFYSDRNPIGFYIMNADGTGQTCITQNLPYHIMWFSPGLSPDGNRIAYAVSYPLLDPGNDVTGDSYIFAMNVDGTGLSVPQFSPWYYYGEPKWSPDGKKIAFFQNKESPARYGIYVMNADGTGVKEIEGLSFYPLSAPTWSPDSTKIVYHYPYSPSPNPGLIVWNVDGSGSTHDQKGGMSDGSPAWSPDSTKVAFVSSRDGNEEIYVMNADATGDTRLTNSQGSDNSPAWGPSTASITVKSPNGGETWQRGTDHTVSWSYAGNPGSTVKLVLLKAGTEVGTINSSVSIGTGGTGSCVWSIWSGRAIGSDYTVSVQSISQPSIKDTSDNYFTISSTGTTPTITVIAPNGGETWKRGTTQTVKWSYAGSPGSYVKVVLLKSGVEVGTATYSTSLGSGGTGSYPWAISSGRAPGTNYRIRVTSVSQPTISDMSNSDFTLTL